MNQFEALSAGRQRLVIACVLLVACLVLALLAEGAIRLRQQLKYGMTDITSIYMEDPVTGLRTAVPSLHKGAIAINSLGFRGPEIAMPKPPGRIRIAFLGGSTTISAEVSSNQATWPHLVTEALKARFPDHEFDYINGGVSGYTAQSSLKNLVLRVKRLEPDIIVIYHATNDLSFRSREAAQAQGIYDTHGDTGNSWLADYSLLWYLVEKNLALRSRRDASQDASSRLKLDVEALTAPFKQDMTNLLAASKAVAKVVAVATFSTKMRPDQGPEQRLEAATNTLYFMPYMTPDGLLASFAAYNRAIIEAAQDQGVILIQGETDIPGDSVHFFDSIHFTDAGSVVMAKRIADGLLRSGELAKLGLGS